MQRNNNSGGDKSNFSHYAINNKKYIPFWMVSFIDFKRGIHPATLPSGATDFPSYDESQKFQDMLQNASLPIVAPNRNEQRALNFDARPHTPSFFSSAASVSPANITSPSTATLQRNGRRS